MWKIIDFAFRGLDGRAIGTAAERLKMAGFAGDGLLAIIFVYLFLRWGWRKRT